MAMQSPDLSPAQLQRISQIMDELAELFPDPKRLTAEEIRDLTPENATMVRIAARRLLVLELLHQERHMHEMDDCGDYLIAATDNWANLFNALWMNDFQNEVEETKAFLTDSDRYPEGGCDGEIRYELLPMEEDELVMDAMNRLK